MSFSVEFAIENSTRYITPLRQFVFAAARLSGQRKFEKKAQALCAAALVEAVDNAIFHAHKGQKGKLIKIALDVEKDFVKIKVIDGGKGIHGQKSFEDKEPPLLRSRGRGIYIMKRLMDQVKMTKKQSGHTVTLRMDF